MAYRLQPQTGDGVQVPLLVVKNLANGREDYFRVALYLLATGDMQPESIAAALHLQSEDSVRHALVFWQGAGLLEEIPDPLLPKQPLPEEKPRLSPREVLLHAEQNPEIAVLLQEAQRIFGEVISQSGCSTLASLYVNDGMSLDYLLLGLTWFAAQGYPSRRLGIVRRRLQDWQAQGIATPEQLEEYLALLEARRTRHEEAAALFGCRPEAFTAQELARIDVWYEQYRYTEPMISLALSTVGDGDSQRRTVRYVNGILRQWNAKGYRQPRDVLAAGALGGLNALPGGRRTAPGQDLLQQRRGQVPVFTPPPPKGGREGGGQS